MTEGSDRAGNPYGTWRVYRVRFFSGGWAAFSICYGSSFFRLTQVGLSPTGSVSDHGTVTTGNRGSSKRRWRSGTIG